MKRLIDAFPNMVHRSYERLFFYNAAGAASKKVRRYEHVDITKEFELLTKHREQAKNERLEELYKKHDDRQALIDDLAIVESAEKHVATFSDGEEADQYRKKELALQTDKQRQLTADMRRERMELVKEFEQESDLSHKILISGIHKVCVLGMIKYHQIRQELFEEVSLHPEILREFEILHYHVENNFPIEKELVYKLVPELYVH